MATSFSFKTSGIKEEIARLKKLAKVDIDQKLQKRKKDLTVKLSNVTPKDTGLAASSWRVTDNSIVNDVPYIDDLNAGSSKQAGPRFIEKTLLEEKDVSPSGTITDTI